MRIAMHPRRRTGFKKQATAAAKAECLPQDILANILVRLPGRDLRRLRRVCKEWRDIIADHTFIQAHMMRGPRAPLTHTIVFFPGFAYRSNGRGFLFDEHWRVTAELAAGGSDDLVGACNGLLCILEAGQGSMKVIEPFTGESLALPLPPEASGLRWTDNPFAYCFGYDATARRYKIVHHGYLKYNTQPLRAEEALDDEELHVYTIGGGEGWRRLHVAFSVYGEAYGDPVYVDGAVYWPTRGHGRDKQLVRLDLATEKITLETAALHLPIETPSQSEMAKFFRPAVDSMPWVMTYGLEGEWDAWFPGAKRARMPKGHVLLHHSFDPMLYLRSVRRSLEFGKGELLFDEEWEEQPRRRGHKDKCNGRTSFVPARRRQRLPTDEDCEPRTFGYSPTVAAAPLALYLGTPSPYTKEKTS